MAKDNRPIDALSASEYMSERKQAFDALTAEAEKRTAQSVADGFGGDTFRRREVSPGVYQCGCRWLKHPERGDVLAHCEFHAEITRGYVAGAK